MSADSAVYIVGHSTLSNHSIAYAIQRELEVSCAILDSIDVLPARAENGLCLLLYDNSRLDFEKTVRGLGSRVSELLSAYVVALFNNDQQSEIESQALRCGAKGLFYQNDSLEHFLKGVRVLFNGELWLSRKTLERLAMSARIEKHYTAVAQNSLTSREIEILTIVSSGASNQETAERLFISPHTVKTHLYNVFKKINVPNRLQAALWAAKNL